VYWLRLATAGGGGGNRQWAIGKRQLAIAIVHGALPGCAPRAARPVGNVRGHGDLDGRAFFLSAARRCYFEPESYYFIYTLQLGCAITDVDIKAKLALRGTPAAQKELRDWRRSQAGA
jgi:hypothetical protein